MLAHCRSSVTIGLSVASQLDIQNVLVAGVDGYTGYLQQVRDEYLHNSGINKNNKNRNYELHSTSNPIFGCPTVPHCFKQMKDLLNITILNKETVLSQDFPVHRFKDSIK